MRVFGARAGLVAGVGSSTAGSVFGKLEFSAQRQPGEHAQILANKFGGGAGCGGDAWAGV